MTNDIAIKILTGDVLGTTEQTHEAVAMAVKALSALPSADVTDTNVGNNDLISRRAAYEVLTAYYHHKTDIQHAALHEALNRVPTAHARWEYVDYGGVGNWHCSACRAISPKKYNFCPTCGRDMRGDYQ